MSIKIPIKTKSHSQLNSN